MPLPPELWTYLPPGLAAAAVLTGLGMRLWKQRDDSKQQSRKSTWDEMQSLISELKEQRDHERRVKEATQEDNDRLRRENARLREGGSDEPV